MTLATLVDTFTNTIVTSLSSLIISVTLLIFFYGIIEYLLGRREGDANKIKAGNTFMTWGLVALFVMFSVYGIVRLSQSVLFNNKDVNSIDIPSFGLRSGTKKDLQIGSPNFPSQTTREGSLYSPQQSANKGEQTSSYFDSNSRAVDTNYSGCPSGRYDAFGGCEPTTSGGAYACDPQDDSCNSSGGGPVVGTVGACKGLAVGAICSSDGADRGTCDIVSYGGSEDLGCIIPVTSNNQEPVVDATSLPGFGEKCNRTSPRCASGLFCDGTVLADTYNTCRPESENVDYSN